MTAIESTFDHGTYTGYNNHGCRCVACTVAARAYHRARLAQRRASMECPTCGGPGGMYRHGECKTCHAYRVRTGQERPEELIRPQPRVCANCARELPRGKSRRNGRCEPCSRYVYRYGVERPESLWKETA